MAARAQGAPLRIAIDARLQSGEMGGVENVVIGLADGLSTLTDGSEEYSFVTWKGLRAWLEPYVSGPGRIVEAPLPAWLDEPRPPTVRQRIGALVPPVRALWRRRPPYLGPPRSDAYFESLESNIVHFPFQTGFLTKTPTIFHPHDLQHVHLPQFFTEEARRHRELWYGVLCRQAAMVAVASRWTRTDVVEHFGLNHDKVRIVPLAPPMDAIPTPSELVIEETSRRLRLPPAYVLYPAQTWPHKNHIALIEALHQIRETRGLVIPLVATGRQTEFFPEIERRAARLGMTNQISWLGFVSADDLAVIYQCARAVIIPTKFEAASAPLWEAFRAGVPAACSNVTSLPEQAGDAALLFDADDRDQIADATFRLWTDEMLRGRLIEAGSRRVSHLSWEHTAQTFRAHYRRLSGRELHDEDRLLLSAAPLL